MSKAGITGMTRILSFLRGYFAKDSDVIKSVNSQRAGADGDLALRVVPGAQQLVTDEAQSLEGTFIIRATGGEASIGDGAAAMMRVRGNNVHTGIVEESIVMTLSLTTRQEGQEEITAELDEDTFKSAVSVSGTTTLLYTVEWSADPATYGVTVTGTPIAGDTITIVYVKGNRGLITVPAPTGFRSTGYNLYNHTDGYARVVKYSASALFIVAGVYTGLQFSSTVDGARTNVSVSSGYFTIAEDGYIWVTGGNSTDTEIYMCGTDWVSGRDCSFAAYTEDEIDLSDALEAFPYGLCRIGGTYDEIDVNGGLAYRRIDRMAYTDENMATVIASGQDWDADESYIYVVLAEPVVTSVSIDGLYTANDHGTEIFDGTSAPAGLLALYGENLVDKLRTDVLTISAQTLTSSQQSQARTNIGAAAASDVTTLNSKLGNIRYYSATINHGESVTISSDAGAAALIFTRYGVGANYMSASHATLAAGTTPRIVDLYTPGSNVTITATSSGVVIANTHTSYNITLEVIQIGGDGVLTIT